MKQQITTIIFDIDGTLLNTEFGLIQSLRDTVLHFTNRAVPFEELTRFFSATSGDALIELGIKDVEAASSYWSNRYKGHYGDQVMLFDGMEELVKELHQKGFELGIVTSKTRAEYQIDFAHLPIAKYFSVVVCVEDAPKPKPDASPLLVCLERCNKSVDEALFIGDSKFDMQCAKSASVAFGLAVWGCNELNGMRADYYFNSAAEVSYQIGLRNSELSIPKWLRWAMELQFIGQAGITYSTDDFDLERFHRIRDISAEMLSNPIDWPLEKVKKLFCNEDGFQTPKLDTRAAIFKEDKILLVKEKDGKWSLPGGWVDLLESIKSNTIKEVEEEAGLIVVPTRLIAILDRNKHNPPIYPYGVAKVFVACKVLDGDFHTNIETTKSAYFAFDELPILSEEKNTKAQIALCFKAHQDKQWKTIFD